VQLIEVNNGLPNKAVDSDELIFGYWPARRLRGEIPPAVRMTDEYQGSGVLNIACTQTELTRARQEKLIDEWCHRLPQLAIHTLVFSSKVPQRLFEAACTVPGLQALSIKWSSIASLEAVSQAASLRSLYLGSSPAVPSLAPLSRLLGLEHLFIENIQEPVDLCFVEALKALREFGLSGARGRTLRVQTLAPLSSLTQLEMLWLVSLQIQNDELSPLHTLSKLASLRTTIRPSSKELKDLCAAVPSLRHFQSVG
jgi:Leucine-rich repeat (LRR) protein